MATLTPDTDSAELLFGRFQVRQYLGSGGFGRVTRCLDLETNGEVAFKELWRLKPGSLLAFKREFRALHELSHPGLVQLGELFEYEGQWGFSMELVPGEGFTSYVRGAGELDEARLRAAASQLVDALDAVHRAGLVHCDVKPENVRVTPEGVVKVLDFGLVHSLRERSPDVRDQVGTLAFMAPEQATDEEITPACDMYAVGVMLYEALTGQLPFTGELHQLLVQKTRELPVRPRERAPAVPPDLDDLCMDLLAIDPGARPSADEVRARLGAPARHEPASPVSEPFVGRRAELDTLTRLFEQSHAGQLRVALLQAESGMGKSALAARFVAELRARRPHALALFGRCHAVEHLPYKCFDGLVDGLSGYLCSLDRRTVDELLPPRAGLLPRLFPTLGRVPSVARAELALRHAEAARSELFFALAELLLRVARRVPLVLVVDDLHAVDAASFPLLETVLSVASQGRILFVFTTRPDPRTRSELDTTLARARATSVFAPIALEPLDTRETSELVQLVASARPDAEVMERLWRATDGHPMFVAELARQLVYAQSDRDSSLDLDKILRARLGTFEPEVREVARLLALEVTPLPRPVLDRAFTGAPEALWRALAVLRSERWLRYGREGELGCYHDRLRDALLSSLSPEEARRSSLRLAEAWQGVEQPDPGSIARHLLHAGEAERAVPFLLESAERAARAAAFEQAALAYETLLALPGVSLAPARRKQFARERAEMLSAAGRCDEAARVLEAMVDEALPAERAELLSRAAQFALHAARVDDGLRLAQRALEAVGLGWPKSALAVLFRLLVGRLRGFPRALPKLTADGAEGVTRQQLEAMWRLAPALFWGDMARAVELYTRHRVLALRARNARHTAFALYAAAPLEVMVDPLSGRERSVLALAETLWSEQRDTELSAHRALARGQIEFARWRARDAAPHLLEAERAYREDCPREAWLLANARALELSNWFVLGKFRKLAEHAARWQRDAEQRDDKFAATSISVVGFGFVRHLMAGDVDAAEQEVERVMEPWRKQRGGVQHLGDAFARHVLCAVRGGYAVERLWAAVGPQFARSFLTQASYSREAVIGDRAAGAIYIAHATEGLERARWIARGYLRLASLARARTSWGIAVRSHIMAEFAVLRGRHRQALAWYQRAQADYERAHHAVGRVLDVSIARLTKRPELERALLSELEDEGFVDPLLWVHAWSPAALTL